MGKRYRHISLEERDRIAEMKSLGHTVTDRAVALGRSKSTLSRELRRNATPAYKVYLPHRAHERAVMRKQEAGSRPRPKNEQIVTYVRSKLSAGFVPRTYSGEYRTGTFRARMRPSTSTSTILRQKGGVN